MLMLLGCAMLHVLLADMLPSPWWAPDLTTAGLVLAIAQRPRRWLLMSATVGLLMLLWTIRFPVQVFCGALVLGLATQFAATQWDLADVRVRCWLVGAATLLMSLWLFWLDDAVSVRILGWIVTRASLTALTVPWLHVPRTLSRCDGAS